MQCQNCQYYSPGQYPGTNSEGGCPQCGEPYAHQPSGTNSDMTMDYRFTPDPGEADMSGNPLQEGTLGEGDGGWKNRQKRDESFASVQSHLNMTPYAALFHEADTEHEIEVPAKIVEVLDKDEAEEKQKELEEKEAGLLGDVGNAIGDAAGWVGDNALPIAEGVGLAGANLIPGVGEVADAAALGDAAAGAAEGGGILGGVGNLVKGAIGAGKNLFSGGGAADAAAGDAAGGGALSGLKNWGQRYLQFEGMHGLLNGGGDQGGGGAPAGGGGMAQGPGEMVQPQGYYSKDYESPSSHGEIPAEDSDDPEKVDPHEKNDDSGEGYFGENDVNDTGGSYQGKGETHNLGAEFEPLLNEVSRLFPKLIHYNILGDGSGAHDPEIQGLMQQFPDLVNHADDQPHGVHKVVMMVTGQNPFEGEGRLPKENMDESESDSDTDNQTTHDKDSGDNEKTAAGEDVDPLGYGQTQDQRPTVHPGICPSCHATLDPSNQVCPQCGAAATMLPGHQNQMMQTQQVTTRTAAPNGEMHDRLMDSGVMMLPEEQDGSLAEASCPECGHHMRGETCANCGFNHEMTDLADPRWEAHVASLGPDTDPQKAAVSQYLLEHGRGEEIPQMIANPAAYAQELAHVQRTQKPSVDDDAGMSAAPPDDAQEDAPPGDTMPVPGMSVDQQMTSAINRYARLASDNAAHPCPKCGSHTTGLNDAEGKSHCHSCGYDFNSPVEEIDELASEHKSYRIGKGHSLFDELQGQNVPGVDAADYTHPRDISREQDSSHSWLDAEGNQLRVGQEYYMKSLKYDVPDLIRVEAVKPDSIEYTLTGEYGLEHRTEVSHEEAQLEDLRFEPTDGSQGTPEYDPNADSGTEENMDDVGRPGPGDQTDLSSAHMTLSHRTAGAKFTPMEQREFIDERGVARNADKLNLMGTHYEAGVEEDGDYFLFGL